MHNDIADELASNGWLSRRIAQDAATVPSGPLSGLTYVAKDLFDVAGMPTIAGSPSNANASPAQTNAAAITLLNQAGARLVGLSNMDALAYGFVTDNPLYGPALNPHDRARSCGGSSGGSAGAVAAGLVDFALGTDTAGSVR
ncbi:MAG: amidase family protein, partial [Pseudomonadota bacterium]